jgi:hypothetical protein
VKIFFNENEIDEKSRKILVIGAGKVVENFR